MSENAAIAAARFAAVIVPSIRTHATPLSASAAPTVSSMLANCEMTTDLSGRSRLALSAAALRRRAKSAESFPLCASAAAGSCSSDSSHEMLSLTVHGLSRLARRWTAPGVAHMCLERHAQQRAAARNDGACTGGYTNAKRGRSRRMHHLARSTTSNTAPLVTPPECYATDHAAAPCAAQHKHAAPRPRVPSMRHTACTALPMTTPGYAM